MSGVKSKATPRRSVPGERYIYGRTNAAGQTVYEVGWRDADRRQHWETVRGGIMAARARRDQILGERAKGGQVQANPRLTFKQAADAYERSLAERVEQGRKLRRKTHDDYRRIIRLHLRERFSTRRLNQIDAEALDRLMADMRRGGLSEATIAKTLGVLSNVFQFARNRLGWEGRNWVAERERVDRPELSRRRPRRVFQGDELRHVLEGAQEPYRTLFRVLADTGARISEALGLRLVDLRLDGDPTVRFAGQIDAAGEYVVTKTEASSGTVPIATSTAAALRAHLAGEHGGTTYVFETATGRPFDRHNVGRSLRRTLARARDDAGEPVFPPGERLPSLHSFRHTTASHLLHNGASADDVARRLRHKDANVTRAVYIHELEDAARRQHDRRLMEGLLTRGHEAT